MDDFILSQIIVGVAFALGIISFQFNSRRAILFWLSGSAYVNAFHFMVLERTASTVLYVIIGSRSLTAAFTSSRRVLYFFFGLIAAGFYFSFEQPMDFVGLLATSLATYGAFQSEERGVRIFMMCAASTWIVHNVIVGTPVAVLMEAMFVTSNLIGYRRFREEKQEGQASSV